jgi:hypothetical protein
MSAIVAKRLVEHLEGVGPRGHEEASVGWRDRAGAGL